MKENNIIVRSTEHLINFANSGKIDNLNSLILEYRKAVQTCIDFIWSNSFEFKNKFWNVSKDQLDLPLFIDYKLIPNTTKLSARAFCSALEQALDIVKSQTSKRKRLLWIKEKLIKENKDFTYIQDCLDKKALTFFGRNPLPKGKGFLPKKVK